MNIKQIFAEQSSLTSIRGKEILNRFPEAKINLVSSHWNIPEINKEINNVPKWNEIKTSFLVLGTKKDLSIRCNGRSTDFIAPSMSNGCYSACSYCYVARRKGYANPITIFTNYEEIKKALVAHSNSLGTKTTPNQCDLERWTYDIGENSDCSIDASLCNNVSDLINLFSVSKRSKLSFATKTVNYDLLKLNPNKSTRIRFSLMPQEFAKTLDIRTSPITERINAIDSFVDAGYEVHVNLSPVIVTDNWLDKYKELLILLDSSLNKVSKDQLRCEVIFLTHNKDLHEINMKWHPKGEDLVWNPSIQEDKVSQTGGNNLRYQYQLKANWIKDLTNLINSITPYMKIRYIF